MPVSSGLQKYFDSQQKKKSGSDMKKKLQEIALNIDPAFVSSFESFHDRIMDIVEENPEMEDMVDGEIGELDMQLQNSKRVHNMQKASAIISASEKA